MEKIKLQLLVATAATTKNKIYYGVEGIKYRDFWNGIGGHYDVYIIINDNNKISKLRRDKFRVV
jgi:hypothetical protein